MSPFRLRAQQCIICFIFAIQRRLCGLLVYRVPGSGHSWLDDKFLINWRTPSLEARKYFQRVQLFSWTLPAKIRPILFELYHLLIRLPFHILPSFLSGLLLSINQWAHFIRSELMNSGLLITTLSTVPTHPFINPTYNTPEKNNWPNFVSILSNIYIFLYSAIFIIFKT